MMIKNRFPLVTLACVFLITFFAYQPGLSGYFFFDDNLNIVENTKLHIQTLEWATLKDAAFSGTSGMFGRPISMLSFALDHLAADLSPGQYKLTNIIIHLLNGFCVFMLSNLLLKAHQRRHIVSLTPERVKWVSVLIAAVWLLHPLQMSSVLYVVQRMTSLSSLFTFLGLICYVYGRLCMENERKSWLYIFLGFFLFTPLAILSKENGALLPLFLFLVELIFFRFEVPNATAKKLLQGIYVICLLIPITFILGYTALHPEWLASTYKIRDFSLSERLMTEARIIWFYLRLLFIPDITTLGMYHDDIFISKNLFNPISTIPACISIMLLLTTGLSRYKSQPILSFGILFFLIGHSIESSVLPLELIHEHRNYLPSFGLIFALCFYLLDVKKDNKDIKIRYLVSFIIVLILATGTVLRANQWGDAVEMKLKEVVHHPQSVRANLDIGSFYAALRPTNQIEANEFFNKAYSYYANASSISPSDSLGLIGLISLHATRELPIEPTWAEALSNRLENYPFSANTGNSLANLLKCVIARKCKGIDDLTERLFHAAIANPSLAGRAKVQILFAWSDFLLKIKNRPEEAMIAAKDAASIAPNNFDDQLNLLVILVGIKSSSEATAQLKITRSLDKSGRYIATLNMLEKLIAQP